MSTRDQPDWWKNVGGENSQDSTLERRSTMWNDGDPVAPAPPPVIKTNQLYWGKFFPRGCRGKIDSLQVYCIRTGVGVLHLQLSPHPNLGPLYEVIITPGAAWGWVDVDFNEMWNYDSLFLWIDWCPLDVSYGADAVQSYDAHYSLTATRTWLPLENRVYIRVVYTGETPGDVPVSGVINTIKIPSQAAEVDARNNVNIPTNMQATVGYFEGAGTMLQATVLIQDDNLTLPTDPYDGVVYEIRINVDNNDAFIVGNRDLTQDPIAVTGRSSVGEFILELEPGSGLEWLIMNLRVPIEFRRYIQLNFYHRAGANLSVDGRLYATLMR